MRMLVLGAGLQGSACAYDLLQNPEVKEVRLADLHTDHLEPFLAPYSGKRLIFTPLDVRDREATLALLRECDAAMSAIATNVVDDRRCFMAHPVPSRRSDAA